jgi:hypothetical protein
MTAHYCKPTPANQYPEDRLLRPETHRAIALLVCYNFPI